MSNVNLTEEQLHELVITCLSLGIDSTENELKYYRDRIEIELNAYQRTGEFPNFDSIFFSN